MSRSTSVEYGCRPRAPKKKPAALMTSTMVTIRGFVRQTYAETLSRPDDAVLDISRLDLRHTQVACQRGLERSSPFAKEALQRTSVPTRLLSAPDQYTSSARPCIRSSLTKG